MSFQKLKSILQRNGYGKITEELSEKEVIEMIKDELLNDEIDLTKTFDENEKIIYDLFYDKNWVCIYAIFSKQDVEEMYTCIQSLLKK